MSAAFGKRVAAAAGAGVESAVITFAAVAGFAVPWLAFDFLATWQDRRWRAEWLTKMESTRLGLAEELRKDPEKPQRRRFRRAS